MNYDKLEEHLRDSAPCSSRFDGFDRGDDGREHCYGNEDYDVEPFEPEVKVTYVVKFSAYCGMSYDLGEFEDRQDALARVKQRLDWAEGLGCEVATLIGFKEWEICEPEGCLMVPDFCGVLTIRSKETSERRY